MKKKGKENYWVSLSDVMTGLMVIFMFIAISYINQRNKVFKEFENLKQDLLAELKTEFENDFKPDKWNAEIDSNLTIRFLDERVFFDYNSSYLKPKFQAILADFFPRFMDIVLKEKYRNSIAEIRIEGHTSQDFKDIDGYNYIYNVKLSQDRTRNVLNYVLFDISSNFQQKNIEEQKLLLFWLTANGLSYGRSLDTTGSYSFLTNKEPDNQKSRRVEIRIVTTTDNLVDKVLNELK